jgi:hypothetical protein
MPWMLDQSQERSLYCDRMAVLIGVDEAGYGPNFGPLCVAATAWRVDGGFRVQGSGFSGQGSGVRSQESGSGGNGVSVKRAGSSSAPAGVDVDLYKLLRKIVAPSPDKAGRKLAIADSKSLYAAGLGLEQLERGVLAALASMELPRGSETLPANMGACIERVCELLAATGADPRDRRRELDCHFDDEQCLPLETTAAEICRLAAKLREVGEENGVALLAVRARLVYPAEFNELVDYFGNKGSALSHVTLELVRQVVDEVCAPRTEGINPSARSELPTAHCPLPTFICLDKHGGRNHYSALLQHHFPESWIEPISENRNRSRYRWRHCETPIEAVFRVGCEELLPTALASMTAKYHREVAMRAFNAFWTARLPDLQPTAGYPGDSHRFKADIAAVQQELGIEDRLLWRCR